MCALIEARLSYETLTYNGRKKYRLEVKTKRSSPKFQALQVHLSADMTFEVQRAFPILDVEETALSSTTICINGLVIPFSWPLLKVRSI